MDNISNKNITVTRKTNLKAIEDFGASIARSHGVQVLSVRVNLKETKFDLKMYKEYKSTVVEPLIIKYCYNPNYKS